MQPDEARRVLETLAQSVLALSGGVSPSDVVSIPGAYDAIVAAGGTVGTHLYPTRREALDYATIEIDGVRIRSSAARLRPLRNADLLACVEGGQ